MEMITPLEKTRIPLIRKSADKIINMYGYQLIEFCKNNNIFIINAKIGKDAVSPELTCKNSSTVDYVLSTAYNFEIIKSFSVLEFNMLYSDAHCPLSIDILIRNVTIQMTKSRASNKIHQKSNCGMKTNANTLPKI